MPCKLIIVVNVLLLDKVLFVIYQIINSIFNITRNIIL
jgi:hypothetical protein